MIVHKPMAGETSARSPIGATRWPLVFLWILAAPAIPPACTTGTAGGTTGGTAGSVGGWHFTPPKGLADEFKCLAGRTDIIEVTGTHTTRYMDSPADGQAYDGRAGRFIVQREVRQSAINLRGNAENICWAGGFITSTFKNFDTYDLMKERDHAGMRWESATSEITGVHVFFTEDGLRPARQSDSSYWTISHAWIDHIRADCLENDSLGSGLVYDTLFSGCSTGISMRAGGGANPDKTHNTVTFDHVLMYIEPMPWPNCTVPGDNCRRTEGVNKITIDGVPYGTSNIIKVRTGSPRMSIKDSIFVARMRGRNPTRSLDVPDNLKGCSNNIMVWLGEGEYPGKYPKDCFTVTKDVSVWMNAVKDWHARHPNVDPSRKPPAHLMGDVSLPRPVELRPPQ